MLLVLKTIFLTLVVFAITPIVYFSLVKYVGRFFGLTAHHNSLYKRLFTSRRSS
ncbi:hypothetical protein K2X40_04415 [Candidatus Babeliales bacterium]|nr:hypothetical protein [Candidatus Babeliales bacterium]